LKENYEVVVVDEVAALVVVVGMVVQ